MADSNRQIVEKYIGACTTADRDVLLEVLAQDAVHYFTPQEMKPVKGAENIAQLWIDAHAVEPSWAIDNIISHGDQVVIEFTNTFTNGRLTLGQKVLNRGCEWYRIEEGKISEIRAYFESDYSRDTGLTDYPYAKKGYTVRRNSA